MRGAKQYTDRALQGDCRAIMAQMPGGIFQAIITSPPYWSLRDYGLESMVWDGDPECEHKWHTSTKKLAFQNNLGNNGSLDRSGVVRGTSTATTGFCVHCGAWLGCLGLEPTPELYVAHLVQIFAEVKRVLRDDGTLWLNIGDSYASTHCGGGSSWGFREGLASAKKAQGPRNFKIAPGLKPKDMVMIPFRLALALQADGWYIRSDIIWHKPNCVPSSVKDRPTTDFEHVFLLAKSKKYYYDSDAIREPQSSGTYKRYAEGEAIPPKKKWSENTAKGGSSKTHMQEHIEAKSGKMVAILPNGRNKRSVWTVSTKPYKDAHFATFPPKLIEPMILAGSSDQACEHCGAAWVRQVEAKGGTVGKSWHDHKLDLQKGMSQSPGGIGDIRDEAGQTYKRITIGFQPSCTCESNEGTGASIVFDPFAGSGTTLAEAKRHGRHYCGIEANPEYVKLIKKRLAETISPIVTVR